jgi:hypothetical protein
VWVTGTTHRAGPASSGDPTGVTALKPTGVRADPSAMHRGTLPDLRPLLASPDDLTLVFQPIVDVAAATVAGYEALSRFPGTATPDV